MRSQTILALLGASTLALTLAAPAWSACVAPETEGIGGVRLTLISSPFSGHSPAPNVSGDKSVRREHAYISTGLAAKLGISSTDLTVNPNQPNPQIRVWSEVPYWASNWSEEHEEYRARKSSALFTVVGIRNDSRDRIWVYQANWINFSQSETHNGQYKILARDYRGANDEAIPYAGNFGDYDNDGMMDSLELRVYTTAVSKSTFTENGTSTVTDFICEPDPFNGRLTERAIRVNDTRLALLVPHGGGIEPGTSQQITPFISELGLADGTADIPVNLWEVEGQWGDGQTHRRWHVTSKNLDDAAFPALAALLDGGASQPQRRFDQVVSLHGFDDSANYRVVVGGLADRNARCLVAQEIDDAVGVTLILDVPAATDVADHNGMLPSNIVNRLSANGGIQIEQSSKLRGNATVREQVARGVARALAEIITNGVPATFCADNGF